MSFKNPFALLAGDDDNSGDEGPVAKSTRPVQVDAAPPAGKAANAQSGRLNNATTRRNIPGQTTVVKQTQAKELPASDAPAGTGFEKENSRDDRAQGRGGRGRGARGGARGGAPRAPRGEGRPQRSERPDRHSATGKTDSNKQEHQGWGGDEGKRELENETAAVTDAAAEASKDSDAPATPVAAEAEASAAPAEEVDNTQSYEEYLASRKAAGRGNVLEGLGQLNIRKANEGQDESQWKDGVLVSKDKSTVDEEQLFPGQAKEKAQRQRPRKEKQTLETEIYFAPPGGERREGGRGGRGGARGGAPGRGRGEGRGRGAPRGGAPRGAPRGAARSNGVNVEDSSAFPALGA